MGLAAWATTPVEGRAVRDARFGTPGLFEQVLQVVRGDAEVRPALRPQGAAAALLARLGGELRRRVDAPRPRQQLGPGGLRVREPDGPPLHEARLAPHAR